jgi:hypothetical protein
MVDSSSMMYVRSMQQTHGEPASLSRRVGWFPDFRAATFLLVVGLFGVCNTITAHAAGVEKVSRAKSSAGHGVKVTPHPSTCGCMKERYLSKRANEFL